MENIVWTEDKLNDLLTMPSQALIDDIAKINGDIMVLGAGGKMGPSLCVLAKRAIKAAGIDKHVYAVSRGSDKISEEYMRSNGVDIIHCDLLKKDELYSLPDVKNIIYMAGRKFGTNGNEWATWAMNATLPAFVADKFKTSNIVVFSSGNIYPIVNVSAGGCDESIKPEPTGEYAMSCLARERAFEFASNTYGTGVLMYRLNFAIDLRYGVLCDVATKIMTGTPISLTTPCFNFIWQGSANEFAIRSILHTSSPAKIMNVTGPETVSIKQAALELGTYLGKEPIFENEPGQDAYLNNSAQMCETFGYPTVSAKTLIRWQAEWILSGGRQLNKPTHFEERKGKY